MKNRLKLIAFAFTVLSLAACKKTYIIMPEQPNQTVDQKPTENYKHTDDYIVTHNWKIIARDDDGTAKLIVWKLQEATGTNNFLIIDRAPSGLFWNPDYQVGKILNGGFVINLNIKR